jgi:hypothetical protein
MPACQDCDGEPPSNNIKLTSNHIILDGEDDPVIGNAGVAPVMWLEMNNIILTEADRRIIVTGEELNDKHINFAQTMLKNQFKKCFGLQSAFLLSSGKHTCISWPPSNALQIIHTTGNHWLVVSTIGCTSEVQVFDSIYSYIDKYTRELLLKLFGTDVNIQMQNAPKQQGIKDCGVFAIAICTLLAYGNFPIGSHITFNQSVMRDHLLMCYENLYLTPFPSQKVYSLLQSHDKQNDYTYILYTIFYSPVITYMHTKCDIYMITMCKSAAVQS